MDLDTAIRTRKSVRKYSSDKPSWEKIVQAIDYAKYAPMAGNLLSVRFILVQNQKAIKEIADASQQNFIAEAQYLVAVVSDESKTKRMFEERAEKYARQQAGAAIENFLLALNQLGLATCWVGFYDDAQVRRALRLPESIILEAIFPIGKPSKVKEREHPKTDLANFLFFDVYGNKKMIPNVIVGHEGR